jgi:hypothetical protein
MKRRVPLLALCLTLLAGSAWLIARTVYAAQITVKCQNNTTITCSGASCNGEDFDPIRGNGYCQCTTNTPGAAADVRNCDQTSGDGPRPEGTPEN